jgi:hypothetical protein
VAGSCKLSNDTSGTIKDGQFIDMLLDYQLHPNCESGNRSITFKLMVYI